MDKKIVALGINTRNNQVCIIRSAHTFEELQADWAGCPWKEYDSTNWGGNDEVQCTLDMKGLALTGRKFKLPKPVVYSGADFEQGIGRNPFEFTFDTVAETRPMNEEELEAAVERSDRGFIIPDNINDLYDFLKKINK